MFYGIMKRGRIVEILEGVNPDAIVAEGKKQGIAYIAATPDKALALSLQAKQQAMIDRKVTGKVA